MKRNTFSEFSVDNASILFLSLMRREHTNSFRFTMTLKETICPETLQTAVDRIWKRFPSVIAGFRPGFFRFRQIPAAAPPQVQPDPGCLHTMTARELRECCYRVFYSGKDISIEAFHALTDGYGAITTFTTLVAEYLYLKNGVKIPFTDTRLDALSAPASHEVEDAFLEHSDAAPRHLPSRFSYQLPRSSDSDWQVRTSTLTIDTKLLLDAAHRHEVTLNTLLSTVLAASVMEVQKKYLPAARLKPVRIMVPVDLRRLFPSKTLRNFSLYALPTLEAGDHSRPLQELCRSFGQQLRSQLSRENLSRMISYNVRTQNAWWFRSIPWAVKGACMRIGYRFFGESNSSLTMTNLGNVQLPEELRPHVENMQAFLTPRAGSPYGCAVLSFRDRLTINMSRFCEKPELEEVFFRNLQAVVAQ